MDKAPNKEESESGIGSEEEEEAEEETEDLTIVLESNENIENEVESPPELLRKFLDAFNTVILVTFLCTLLKVISRIKNENHTEVELEDEGRPSTIEYKRRSIKLVLVFYEYCQKRRARVPKRSCRLDSMATFRTESTEETNLLSTQPVRSSVGGINYSSFLVTGLLLSIKCLNLPNHIKFPAPSPLRHLPRTNESYLTIEVKDSNDGPKESHWCLGVAYPRFIDNFCTLRLVNDTSD